MKYGESAFDIIYLLFGLICGIYILMNRKNKAGMLMGIAVLVLAGGDAFHLIPRVLNYFVESDFSTALGLGKAVTSVTMTVFYVLLFHVWQRAYKKKVSRTVRLAVYALAAIRIILCLFPQNGWFENESSMAWGIIRNVPFVLLGILIILLFYSKRGRISCLRWMWLLITLSFLFYIPVAVFAGIVPMLGMLMLPKTVCYMIMICDFVRYVQRK